MDDVSFNFRPRAQPLRPGIVLPDAAAQEPGFEANAAELHKPRTPPRRWPEFRGPGTVVPLPGAAGATRGYP